MTRTSSIFAIAVLSTLGLGTELHAQAADDRVEQELRTLVTAPTPADQDRKTVLDFLSRADVQRAASQRGIDTERLAAGVQTLGADEAASLAERVRDAEEELAGGDTLVISTTTVIIALLVIILIIVV